MTLHKGRGGARRQKIGDHSCRERAMHEPSFRSFHSTRAHLTPHPKSVMSPYTCLLFDVMGFILHAQYECWTASSSPAVPGCCQATSAAAGLKSKLRHSSHKWANESGKRRERWFCTSEFICAVIKALIQIRHQKEHHLTTPLTEPKPSNEELTQIQPDPNTNQGLTCCTRTASGWL